MPRKFPEEKSIPFREIASANIFQFLMRDIDLVGIPSVCLVLREQCLPLRIRPELLTTSTKGRIKSMKFFISHENEQNKQEILWSQTLKEFVMGFLEGLFASVEEAIIVVGANHILINRRFSLLQDEQQKRLSCKWLKLVLEDLDYFLSLVALARKAVVGRDVRILLNDGPILTELYEQQSSLRNNKYTTEIRQNRQNNDYHVHRH